MFSKPTTKLGVVVAGVAMGAMLVPSVAPAAKKKTHKVKVLISSTSSGPNNSVLTGPITGGTFGKGKQTGTSAPPKIDTVWHLKGGTITVKTADGHLQGADIVGTFKFTKGTGKYKGIKGKGTVKAPLATNPRKFVYKGKAKY